MSERFTVIQKLGDNNTAQQSRRFEIIQKLDTSAVEQRYKQKAALQSGVSNIIPDISTDLKSGTNSIGKRKPSAGLDYYVNGNPIPSKNPAPGIAGLKKAAEDYAKKATAGDGFENYSLEELKKLVDEREKQYKDMTVNGVQRVLNRALGIGNAGEKEYKDAKAAYNNRLLLESAALYPHKADFDSKSAYDNSINDLTYLKINNLDKFKEDVTLDKYRDISESEIKVYNYIYKTEGEKRASQYLSALENTLKNRAIERENTEAAEFADKHPIKASVNSIGTNIAGALEQGGNMVKYLATGDTDINRNSMLTSTTRGKIMEKVNWEIGNWDAFDFIYGTAMSGADSILASYVPGGNIMLGLSAAGQASNDILQRGGTNEQAFWTGLAAGVFESLFEKISIGNFNALKETAPDTVKTLIKNIAKSMLVNASEEAATEIANITYDSFANADISQYQQLVSDYLQEGYSKSEAEKKAVLSLAGQVVEAGAGGALMGLGMGGVGSATGYLTNRKANNTTATTQTETVNTVNEKSKGIDSESTEYIIGDNESGVKTDISKSENETDNSINNEFGTKSVFTEYSAKKYKADTIESYIAKEHGREKLSDDQLQIVMVARKLGHSVVFEDAAKTRGFKSDGYIENDGTIHIDYDNTKPVQFVFKHELTHYAEGSELYKTFVKTVKASKTYSKWIAQKVSGEDSAAVKSAKYRQSIIDGYAASGIELTPTQAESELIADFVGDTLFTEDGSGLESIMSDMNAKQRKSFIQYIKDFFAYIKDKLSRNKTATSDILRLEKMFNETLSTVEQKNTADEGDVKYSLRVGAEADVERALNDKNYTEDVFLTESSPSIITSQKGARNLPMLMKASHIRENIFTEQEAKQNGLKVNSNINYHGLGKDLFLKVIDGLDDVKLAYRGTKNASNPSRRENYFLLISQYKDANGNIINIPVFIDEKGQYNRVFIDTNKIATVFGRTDINDYINREVANKNLVRIKNKSTQASELTSPINASYSKNAFTDNTVSQKAQSVKNNISENSENSTEKLSDRTPEQLDTDYMQAVNNGDMETARRLVDEAAKKAGYSEKLYHQTENDFFIFDTRHKGAGTRDNETPFGIFMKKTDADIGIKGKKQMPLFAKINNPLKVNNRDSLVYELNKLSPKYQEIKEKLNNLDKEYQEKFYNAKNAWREWIKEWRKKNPNAERREAYNDPEFEEAFSQEEKVVDEWTEKATELDTQAKEIITAILKENGYDGIVLLEDEGSFGRSTEAYIALDPTQVKSADPVTYDDNGNIIPLSQRFNAENSDIRYSIPFNQAELLDKYDRGEISREEYLNQSNENWKEAVNNYGTIKAGENPVNDIPVPQSVDGKQKTQRFARTVIESGKLTNRMVEDMGADILLGKFAYTPVSDELAQAAADKAVKGGFAESSWQEAVNASKLITKDKIAIGEKLLMQAIANKDTKRALELSSELADVLTRNGQNIQAASMFKKMTGAGKLLTVQQYVNTLNKDLEAKYGENAPTVKINEFIAQQIAESKPGEDIYSIYEDALQDVAAQVPATFLDKWNAWRYMSMLVNPTTHIRNIAGNGLFIPSVRMKDFISASLETAFIKDKDKRTKSVVIKKEYKEFAEKDLTRSEVKNALKSGGKFNIETEISEKQRIFKNNALEFVRVGNGNLLETEDLIFKNIHYSRALAGFLQARGADLNNIDENLLWEARAYAVQEAMKATFNDANSISTALSAAANKNKVLDIAINGVLPFKKTPVNIVMRGVEYSPIGLLKTVVKGSYDLKQGKITASEYIDGLGAGISGTVVFAIGALLSSLGWATGGFGDDDEDKFKKLNGEQEYALQLFGKSYTIDWAAPACIPFFIGVETVKALREDNDDFKLSDITEAMWNSLEPVINLSMLSGVQSMIESVKYAAEDKSVISLAGNIAKSYFSQGLPTVLGKTARTLDSKRRSNYIDKNSQLSEFTQSAINTAKSKIPGLEATRPEYINAWGQAESNGNIIERIFGNFVSPGYYSDIEYSEISEELLRLSESVKGEDVNVLPKTAQKSFEVNGKTKYLTAEEYTKYAKAKGQYSYDYVSEFVNSSEYKKLTDEERAKVISNLYKYANAKAKTEVSDYDITKSFKSVSQWEKQGKSPVVYYLGKVLSEK